MKAIIYARVSTKHQDTARQFADLRAYAANNGIEIIKEFSDNVSGATRAKDRKGSAALLSFVKANKVGLVLTTEISRLGRSSIDTQNIIHDLVFNQGVDLYIASSGIRAYDKSGKVNPLFKLLSDTLANLAEMERATLTERIKSGQRARKANGGHLGRKAGAIEKPENTLAKYPALCKTIRETPTLSIRKLAALHQVSINTVRKVKELLKTTS